jgi:ATP synthase F1 gamma subunit
MSRLAETRRLVEDYQTAELITGALQDIGSTKMKAMRGQFEENARFFAGIREVYSIVKTHALEGSVTALTHEPAEHRPGRDIYIALTSNKRFYGTLNRDIMRAFAQTVRRSEEADFLVVGQTGAQYLDEAPLSHPISRTQFENDRPTEVEMRELFSRIGTGYRRVFILYPHFVNPFRQDPVMTDITQTPEGLVTPEEKAEYIFEPEIPRMLEFFEAQVRRVLFERVILETELARVAARAMKMRNARENASDLREVYERQMRREIATLAEMRLMETFIGYTFWNV